MPASRTTSHLGCGKRRLAGDTFIKDMHSEWVDFNYAQPTNFTSFWKWCYEQITQQIKTKNNGNEKNYKTQ